MPMLCVSQTVFHVTLGARPTDLVWGNCPYPRPSQRKTAPEEFARFLPDGLDSKTLLPQVLLESGMYLAKHCNCISKYD